MHVHWKDWCWSWNSNTLASWCEDLTYLKRPWCWERLTAGGKGDDRGWNGWMASLTHWTWVWVNSGSWWWTGRPGVLQSMGSQRVGHDWATELKWPEVDTPGLTALRSLFLITSTKSLFQIWPQSRVLGIWHWKSFGGHFQGITSTPWLWRGGKVR